MNKGFEIKTESTILEEETSYVNQQITEININQQDPKQGKVFGDVASYQITNPDGKQVTRTFKDFQMMRKAIVINYPGLFVPKFPDKKFRSSIKARLFESKEAQMIDERAALDQFLDKLNRIEHIKGTDIYDVIYSPNANISRSYKQLSNPPITKILE